MSWWLWFLLLPVVAFAAFCAGFWALSLTVPTVTRAVGIGSRVYHVRLHYQHWLPRVLRSWGIAMSPHIYLRGMLWPQGIVWDGRTHPTQAWQCAHELVHIQQAVRWGWLIYRVRAFAEPLIWWRHNRRPMEREANARQRAVVEGTDPEIDAPWLASFDNAGMPG